MDIGDIMRHCRNYFEYQEIIGGFIIADGRLSNVNLGTARYIAIKGSTANDGVHRVNDVLDDETFEGQVFLLAPPANFLKLCEQITAYDEKTPVGSMMSETFGNYSYSRGNAGSADWTSAFSAQLARYQMLFSEVMV